MESSRRDWLLLAVLCLAGVFLGRTQDSAREQGRSDLISSAFQLAIDPAAKAMTGALNGISDVGEGMFSKDDLVRKVRRLEQQVRAAALYDSHVARLQEEVDHLRKMLDLPAVASRRKVAADVIGYFPRESRITLSVGSSSGIHKGAPVVTGDGFVGIVSTVSGDRSQVLLLSHSRLQIGAITARTPPAAGLLRGESSTSLLMEITDMNASVAQGDLVMTAGFSERIPKAIPIGHVYQVENDMQFGRKLARITPAVQVGSVREVLVLL
jgi:rod shape-determining protein MreC